MGNILSAIYDDEEDYERLCKKYGVTPIYGVGPEAGPYGWHSQWLGLRDRDSTEDDWPTYLNNRKRGVIQLEILRLKDRIDRLQKELKELESQL